jgi:diguanylate cyclase (GGDEF)-like protein/PAS domain S-box-containing protein
MLVVGADGTILAANEAAGRIFEYEPGELLGRPVEVLVPGSLRRKHEAFRGEYGREPKARAMGTQRDFAAVAKSGKEIAVEIGLSPFPTEEGMLTLCVVVDLSARVEMEERLTELAEGLGKRNKELLRLVSTDGLTSLKTRREFLDSLRNHIEIAVRHGRPLSVLLLDLDHFKEYNDGFGHLAGDEVLQKVGSILRRVARRSDIAARIGGEEFGIILPETDAEGAVVIGERFRQAVESEAWPRRSMTVSVGAVTVAVERVIPRPKAPEVSDLLREADRALYRAKREGRNRVTHADDVPEEG